MPVMGWRWLLIFSAVPLLLFTMNETREARDVGMLFVSGLDAQKRFVQAQNEHKASRASVSSGDSVDVSSDEEQLDEDKIFSSVLNPLRGSLGLRNNARISLSIDRSQFEAAYVFQVKDATLETLAITSRTR